MNLTYQTLQSAVADALAFSFLGHFQPSEANSPPYRVVPPTYAPPRKGDPPQYLTTETGEVRLDLPQSFANRLEEVIASENLTPSFNIVDGHGVVRINSRQLPHRVFDAAMRDSNLEGQPFFKSPLGASLRAARPTTATALFRHAPETLLFGVWDSHAGGGNQVLRMARVFGTGCKLRPGGAMKSDPLNITQDAGKLYLDANFQLTLDPKQADKDKNVEGKTKASIIGHGSIPAKNAKDGVDVEDIILQGAIHLGVLRKYRFPVDNGKAPEETDVAVRTALLAMGIWAVQSVATRGMWLRSGCDLVYQDLTWLLRYGGGKDEAFEVSLATARKVLDEALAALAGHNLNWENTPITLKANKELLKAIEISSTAIGIGEVED
jgi:CRISPR-associated protein Csb1